MVKTIGILLFGSILLLSGCVQEMENTDPIFDENTPIQSVSGGPVTAVHTGTPRGYATATWRLTAEPNYFISYFYGIELGICKERNPNFEEIRVTLRDSFKKGEEISVEYTRAKECGLAEHGYWKQLYRYEILRIIGDGEK